VFLQEAARKHKITILDYEVDVDHVHVVASLPLTMTPTQAVCYLKGMSSKGMFIVVPELRRFYKKGHLWSPGKFVGSVGHITLDKAKNYLEAHHAKSFLILIGIPAPTRRGGVARRASLQAGEDVK
jgi:putative transposase